MNRTCAVCGQSIRHSDLCNTCYKEYVKLGEVPTWLQGLIKIQSNFERRKANSESTFSELGKDMEFEDELF